MTPEVIIDTYSKSQSQQERNILSNQLMELILNQRECKYWNFPIVHLDDEEWKDISGLDGRCKISSYGRIKKIKNGKESISYYRSASGRNYPHTRFGSKRTYITVYIHIEVGKSFVPNPNNYPIVNHIDGDKNNCYYKNLEWSTDSLNNQHARNLRLNNTIGENHSGTTLTNDQAIEIFQSEGTHIDIAARFNVKKHIVQCIKSGKTWGSVTGKKQKEVKKKLLPYQVIEIYQSFLKTSIIAKKYGVTNSAILFIKNGISYRNITFNLK